MKTSTQPKPERSVWTSRRFDQRVAFDAGELRRQPDFGPSRAPTQPAREPRSGSYARHFYGDRAAPAPKGRAADEGLGDVGAAPHRAAPACKALRPPGRGR